MPLARAAGPGLVFSVRTWEGEYASRDVPNVFVVDIDGGNRWQVTARKTPCGRVKWSPDGRHLSFVSFERKYPQLFVVPAEGGDPRQLTELDGGANFAHWRPE